MSNIKKYKKDESEVLSKNFTSKEFDCHGKNCCNETEIDLQLIEFLQKIRDHFGKPLHISSGYRCPVHNRNVGGATGSRHGKGMAADIYINGVEPAEIAKYAESIGIKGIGLYETKNDGFFVHIDTRDSKYFWYGQAQKYRETFGGKIETNKENTQSEEKIPTKPEVKFDPYIAEVTASKLNCRRGPSMSYQVIGVFNKGEKVSIIEEKEGWGQVKDKGWISLTYVKKHQTIPGEAHYIDYKVKKNDSLWGIAAEYLGNGSRYKEIMVLNNLTSDIIRAGQILKVPVK